MEKELKEMTVRDVLLQPEYLEQLQEVMDGEVWNQQKAGAEARKQELRIGRTPLDRLREAEVWEAENIRDYFGAVLNKSLVGFGAAEREYINLVGMAAFRRTVVKLKEKESPEASGK